MTKLMTLMTSFIIFTSGISFIGCADISSSSDFGTSKNSGSWYRSGFEWPHDGDPFESDHCIIYSDAAGDDARQTLAEYAEEALIEIKQLFEIENHSIFLYPPGHPGERCESTPSL